MRKTGKINETVATVSFVLCRITLKVHILKSTSSPRPRTITPTLPLSRAGGSSWLDVEPGSSLARAKIKRLEPKNGYFIDIFKQISSLQTCGR